MLKPIGAVMIGFSCAYLGFAAAARLRRRMDFLNAFLSALSAAETEITLGNRELGEIFSELAADASVGGLFGGCAGKLAERGIRRAWREAVEETAEDGFLTREDISAVLSLGNELGMSDVRGQQKAIARTSELVRTGAAAAAEEYARLGRVYRGCGVLAGLFVIAAIV